MNAQQRLARLVRRNLRGLWRLRDFRRLWLSLTVTSFGAQITNLALPLTAALLLHATPLQMGILVALETLPFALVSLHAGVLLATSACATSGCSCCATWRLSKQSRPSLRIFSMVGSHRSWQSSCGKVAI